MTASPLPFASLGNEFLRLDYLPSIGPRIIGLYAKGRKNNLLAETPDIHWHTPHGEYYLRGGHRLWTAPEDPFYTCPEENVNVTVEEGKVSLKSDVDASGLEKEIFFRLDKNCVALTHRVTWHGKEPIKLAPWTITQLPLGGMAILPQSDADGLLPNRNLVFWPYSRINDERLELHDDLILLHGRPSKQAFKIGNYNSHGWIAYLRDDVLFTKRFSNQQNNVFPDLGCNVEAYVQDSCLELETLASLSTLNPKESVTLEEIWEVTIAEYSTTLEDARRISMQISLNEKDAAVHGEKVNLEA
jgi:hypothetical protein